MGNVGSTRSGSTGWTQSVVDWNPLIDSSRPQHASDFARSQGTLARTLQERRVSRPMGTSLAMIAGGVLNGVVAEVLNPWWTLG